ncbi:hypothetical protein GHT07_16690 [Caenimonas koreensis DSM 17982]|uniref:Uncharacterized protein n=1 Tax=Caenimonas koreensis DSM 17982 TaxID=1121255 RepID=A0A844BBV3_9BURK|nr:hypothetical protein [Caenimonas koreensis]MRD48927.1 hypothetical protein [Caenimonas koreensis DSM 17982]
MLTFLCLTLAVVTLVALTTHVVMWFWAYQEVRAIDSWSQQARVLNAWWIFDKSLLPKERDHLRVTALWSGLVGALGSWALVYLVDKLR